MEAVEAAAAPAADAEAAARVALPPLSPIAAPDPSEGPEAQAEYQAYMARFAAGDTLAQRWHRLAEKGLLDDIRADYEEWQNDLMLQQLQAQIQAGNKGRKRRQAEESEPDPDAPRQVRLQDSARGCSWARRMVLQCVPGFLWRQLLWWNSHRACCSAVFACPTWLSSISCGCTDHRLTTICCTL